SPTRPRSSGSSIARSLRSRCTARRSRPRMNPASCWRRRGTIKATSTASAISPRWSAESSRSPANCRSWGSKLAPLATPSCPALFMLIALGAFGLPFWGAVFIGIIVSALVLGVLFKRLLVDPMIRHGVLPLAIATMALALFLKEAVKDFYGAEAQPFPPLAADINVSVFGAAVALQSLIVVAIAI